MAEPRDYFVHPTAEVHADAHIGGGTMIWHWVAIREGARIGPDCRLGQGVYVDHDVTIGARTKIQNGVSVYHGVTLGDDVFVGPNAVFTNDRIPRADNTEWQITPTLVQDGASIGANATIVCGVTLGERCMVAAGSIVTRDVPPYGLVMGNPARLVDFVDRAGTRRFVGPDAGPAEAGR